MRCANCQQEVPNSAKFCGYCGHSLKQETNHDSTIAFPKSQPKKAEGQPVLELIKQGREHWKAGRFEEAKTTYIKAIELFPAIPHTYFDFATLLDGQKENSNEALRLFERFVELSVTYPKLVPQIKTAKKRIAELKEELKATATLVSTRPPAQPRSTEPPKPVKANVPPMVSTASPRNPERSRFMLAGVVFGVVILGAFCAGAIYLVSYLVSTQSSYRPTDNPVAISKNIVVVLDSKDFYPFVTFDGNGGMQGLDIDILTDVCRHIGCTPTFVAGEWYSAMNAVQQGNYQILAGGVPCSQELDQMFDLSAPYVTYGKDRCFAFQSGNSLVVSINSALQEMRSDGALDIVVSRWITLHTPQPTQVPIGSPTFFPLPTP